MKCQTCGAENPADSTFCGDCGTTLEPLPVQSVTPSMPQPRPVAAAPLALFPLSQKTKKRLVIGAIAVAVVLVIASVLGYLWYYQPVRGSGTVSTTTIDAGQMVEFGCVPSQGVSPYHYHWIFGDGGVSAEQNPRHSYISAGTYQAIVTLSDTAGKTTTWTTTIIVNPLPSVVAMASPSVSVLTLNASFTAQAQGGTPDYSYHWQFGDGTSGSMQNPTHHYSTGVYTATVTVTDGKGMTASGSTKVSVNLNLTTGITYTYIGGAGAPYNEAFNCTPSQGIPPYSYLWQFGDGQSSTLQNPLHKYAQGIFTVHLNVTDSIGEIVEIQRTLSF